MTRIELELLTEKRMLYMFEEGIRGGMCQALDHYKTANNKYMKNYDKNIESSFLQNLDANNLYGWAMTKTLPIGEFKRIEKCEFLMFDEEFIKNYDENSDNGFLYETDVEYPKIIGMSHTDLPFLSERRKIGKVDELVVTIEDKEKYVLHISALKQALNHGLKVKRIHRIIQFKQKAWLMPYIEKNTELKAAAKNDFKKDFFKLVNSVFGKTIKNLRKHRDIRLVTTDKRRNKLVSELNYYSTKYISESLMIIEMKRTQIFMSKLIYLGQAILDISKTRMYEFWYDYIKLKYGDKATVCYRDTDSFIIHIKTEDIANDVSKWFDTSEYDKKDNRPLLIGINIKVIGIFKDELKGKIMT